MKLKPYPQKNPRLPESQSRFAVEVVEVDMGGKKSKKDIIKAAEPMIPLAVFHYDAEEKTGRFQPRLDQKGKPLLRRSAPIYPYIPSPDIKELVRLAQILQRPILIKGEPGSGKTQLARAVAYEWYGEEYKNHFFEWYVKSTSKAVDGLYTYDHISRLRNAQLQKNGPQTKDEDIRDYRQFGPMGKAFLTSTEDSPSILLIDEIDKADIDFPNDLLLELDERRFTIPETGEEIETRYPPLIFITSNDEKELPEAFLRRCLFMYITFPGEEQLKEIIQAHLPGLVSSHDIVIRAAAGAQTDNTPRRFIDYIIERFYRLRDEIKTDPSDNKRVSTSELLDWMEAYYHDLSNPGEQASETLRQWIAEYGQSGGGEMSEEWAKKGIDNLPFYYQAILKTQAAVSRRQAAKPTYS